jgi:hypothetical protein
MKRLKTGGKTYANSEKLFSAFSSLYLPLYTVYYPLGMCAGTRGNDDSSEDVKRMMEKVSFCIV